MEGNLQLIEKNALEALQEVMQQRNWHKGLINANVASGYKSLLKKKKLSHEKATEILELIGYVRVRTEAWVLGKNNFPIGHKEKLIKQLFMGKICGILGASKTIELHENATSEIEFIMSNMKPKEE